MSHYRQSGPPSLRPPGPSNMPQATHLLAQPGGSFDQLWKCSFCGSIHPSERDRDIHMTDQCPASPMGVRDDTAVMQSVKRPPMVKAHTIQSPSDLQYYSPAIQTDSHQGYGYPNQPLFQSQARAYQIRPNYLQSIESKQSQQNNEKTQILIETKDKQISDLKMQILDQQAKDQTYQTQVEKQIKELNEELEQLKKENEKNIKELESSFEKLTNESKALEIQLEESKNEFNKLQEKGEEYYQNSQQQIDVLKTELETAMNELKINRKKSGISKQLITKLNSDIIKLQEADSEQKIEDLERQFFETERARTETEQKLGNMERQLFESERTRTETEQKLGDMATEIANMDSKIQILDQNITILQNKGQVAQATPPPVMPYSASKQKEDKKLVQKLSKDSKQKHTDTSGATPGATLSELTPQIIPVANRSGKSSTKIAFRPGMYVNTIKLKSLPNLAEHQGKQVIYLMNKRYELGILMVLFDAPTKLGMRNVTFKYAGIKLHNPVGNCSGEFRTKRLFDCEQNYGICVPYEDVLVPVV